MREVDPPEQLRCKVVLPPQAKLVKWRYLLAQARALVAAVAAFLLSPAVRWLNRKNPEGGILSCAAVMERKVVLSSWLVVIAQLGVAAVSRSAPAGLPSALEGTCKLPVDRHQKLAQRLVL
jgi:hypothetical protein